MFMVNFNLLSGLFSKHLSKSIFNMKKSAYKISEFETYRGLLKGVQRCAETNYDHPIIFILGSTGVGKTKLSIELAKRFNGEIISADSMQVYKGMNIATNKATEEERSGIAHHCFDYIDPFQAHTVVDFRHDATKAINDIIARDKLPIIVGGTNYYIECLLFSLGTYDVSKANSYENSNIKTNNSDDHSREVPKTFEELLSRPIVQNEAEKWPSELLHSFLSQCDPTLAVKTSPNNIRKIIRFLQIYQALNRPASEVYSQQKKYPGFNGKSIFPNAVIFWLDCDRDVLNKRLDSRCDEMIANGLLNELSDFHTKYNLERIEPGVKPNYTEGIFQTIGLKEFHKYLLLDKEEQNSYSGSVELGKCIILFKTRTKSYVPKQLKWIRRRFLTFNQNRILPDIYRLDTTNLDDWNESVLAKAIKIYQIRLELILNFYPSQNRRLKCILDAYRERVQNDDDFEYVSGQFFCDVCKINVSGGKSFDMHLKSRSHDYNVKQMKLYKNRETTGVADSSNMIH